MSTIQGHFEEDSVAPLSPHKQRRLDRHTLAASATDAATAAASVTGNEGQVGRWGPVVDWPVVAVHMALLPNGKVLAYDSMGDNATETYPVQDRTRATVWDPATGTQTPVNVTTGFNIFCSGLAHLMDGSVFVAGGNKNAQLEGIVQTHVFDPVTNTWSLGPNMAAGRWYPSVTPLSNGEMLITEGGPDMPEVRKTDGGLRALNTASLNLPLYPWIDVAPDGRAFYSGPDQTMRSLGTAGGGSWQSFGQRDGYDRGYGSHALYDAGKILVAGGAFSLDNARVINLNGPTPQVSVSGLMATGRRQFNLTVLADGTVLATGGNSSGAPLVDLNNGVYNAELWNPANEQWHTLAAMRVTRQYHSTALLLPDGRVLSAGGGICGTCDSVGYLAKNAEVFSPPYLFKKDGSGELAVRPEISSAPSEISYDVPFAISTPNPASIKKVALARLGAVTHSVNMEQRYVPLSFTVGGGGINATAPNNANVAPPGVYMLFLIDANGVPSVAKMVRVGSATVPPPPKVFLVSPTEGATGVSRTAPIVVFFDQAMNKPSAEAAFSLKRTSDGAPVAGRLVWYGNALIFLPNSPLANGTGYTATEGTGALGSAGNALEAPKSWQFTTATQPLIAAVVPADNATEVLPNGLRRGRLRHRDGQALRPGRLLVEADQRRYAGKWKLRLVLGRASLQARRRPCGRCPVHGDGVHRSEGSIRKPAAGGKDLALYDDSPPDHRSGRSRQRNNGSPSQLWDVCQLQQTDGQALNRGRLFVEANKRRGSGERELQLERQRPQLHPELAAGREHPIHRSRGRNGDGPGRQHSCQPNHLALHDGGLSAAKAGSGADGS